jgi:hypothetical protein
VPSLSVLHSPSDHRDRIISRAIGTCGGCINRSKKTEVIVPGFRYGERRSAACHLLPEPPLRFCNSPYHLLPVAGLPVSLLHPSSRDATAMLPLFPLMFVSVPSLFSLSRFYSSPPLLSPMISFACCFLCVVM